MRIWISYVAAGAAFDPARHAVESDEYSLFDLTMQETEGQVAEITIERVNAGWSAVLSAAHGNYQHALISTSLTGRPADATLLARGYVAELPGNLLAATQTITIRCGPVALEEALLAWAKINIASGPETDFRLGDDREDPATYLAGRCGDYHIDPRTHAITVSDSLVGDRVIDLTDSVIDDDGLTDAPGSFGEPVSRITSSTEATWSQGGQGTINIASRIPRFSTMNPDALTRLATAEVTGEGWNLEGGIEARVTSRADVVLHGIKYKATHRTEMYGERIKDLEEEVVQSGPESQAYRYKTVKVSGWEPLQLEAGSGATENVEDFNLFDAEMSAQFLYQSYYVQCDRFLVSWSFSQPRREVLDLRMNFPSGLPKVEELRFSVSEELLEPPAERWQRNTEYTVGQFVLIEERRYRCGKAHRSSEVVEIVQLFDGTWIRDTAREDREFLFETDETTGLREHILCRMRKEGRRRQRSRNLKFSVNWSDAIGLTTRDMVRITVPWSAFVDLPVTGKVVSITRTWTSEGEAKAEIEIGVTPGGRGPMTVPETALGDVNQFHIDARQQVYRDAQIPLLRAGAAGAAVQSSRVLNDSSVQSNRMRTLLSAGKDPADGPAELPTSVIVRMRDLVPADEILRTVTQETGLTQIPSPF